MINRCTQPTNPDYERYSALGICEEWRRSYAAFLADVGRRPSIEHSIERIDNERGYFPGNCRWATPIEQARNKRTSRWVTIGGETKTLAEWAEFSSLNPGTLADRINRGVQESDLLNPPDETRKRKSLREVPA